MTLDARIFEYAWATASAIEPLPLADVIAWYDALQIGAQQVATTAEAKALFLLLHLARGEEDESLSVLRLAQALQAMSVVDLSLTPFFALRDAIVSGSNAVLHPLADDALDERVDEESLVLVNAADLAAGALIGALQERIRGR